MSRKKVVTLRRFLRAACIRAYESAKLKIQKEMDNQSLLTYKSTFDSIMHTIKADDGTVIEVWYARELQTVCGYSRWENFATAINRAKDACKTQNISVDDHFRDVTKMIEIGKGGQRPTDDILLTRLSAASDNRG